MRRNISYLSVIKTMPSVAISKCTNLCNHVPRLAQQINLEIEAPKNLTLTHCWIPPCSEFMKPRSKGGEKSGLLLDPARPEVNIHVKPKSRLCKKGPDLTNCSPQQQEQLSQCLDLGSIGNNTFILDKEQVKLSSVDQSITVQKEAGRGFYHHCAKELLVAKPIGCSLVS